MLARRYLLLKSGGLRRYYERQNIILKSFKNLRIFVFCTLVEGQKALLALRQRKGMKIFNAY